MKATIEAAIKNLTEKAQAAKSDDVLKYSQAALNLAHTEATLEATRRENDKAQKQAGAAT